MSPPPDEIASFQAANGTDLKSQVGFLARSIVVDNNTSAWCYSPDAGRYVAPGTGGAFSFVGTHRAALLWQTPPGRVAGPVITTEEAQVVFSESSTPPSSGYAQSVPPVLGASAIAFPRDTRVVANYAFDAPEQHFARGIVIFLAVISGAGTAGIGYHEFDATTGFDSAILSSLNIATGATVAIKIYPGIAVVANQTANNIVDPQPRIVLSVVGASVEAVVTYSLLP